MGPGCDLLRVRWATYADTLDDVVGAGLRTGDPRARPAADDGAAEDHQRRVAQHPDRVVLRAVRRRPPSGVPAGQPNLSGAELRELLARPRGRAGGGHHAIGDAAVREALAAYADTGARGSVEHAQMARREDVRRMAELGSAPASSRPTCSTTATTERIWGERSERCFAFRWMLEDGVELALGSDAPVSPLDPWLALAAAVHRSADERDPWHGEQALTVREALAASVDGQPTVRPGSRGDLVLLDRDPLLRDLDQTDTSGLAVALRAMSSALTVVDGRVVHDAR